MGPFDATIVSYPPPPPPPLPGGHWQGYKLGSWATRSRRLTGGPEDPFPRPAGVAFWWRLVFVPPPPRGPGGFAAFVNGRLIGWSAGPPGSAFDGGGGAAGARALPPQLQVGLPAAGEAGERVSLRVTQLWWGASELDAAAAAEVTALAGSSGSGGAVTAAGVGGGVAAAAAAATASRNLWVTGVPESATLPELLRAFQAHGALDVTRAAQRQGAAIVAFADAAAAAEGLRSVAAAGGVRIHGALLAVAPGVTGR